MALSAHWSLNPETSWFFNIKLEPTLCVTRQNMQYFWYCPKNAPYNNTATLEWYCLQWKGNESSSNFKASRDSTEDSLWHLKSTCRQAQWSQGSPSPVADPAKAGCVSNDRKLDLVDIHGGLTAQKHTDDILRPHVEPHIVNHVLANRGVFMQDGASFHICSQGEPGVSW